MKNKFIIVISLIGTLSLLLGVVLMIIGVVIKNDDSAKDDNEYVYTSHNVNEEKTKFILDVEQSDVYVLESESTHSYVLLPDVPHHEYSVNIIGDVCYVKDKVNDLPFFTVAKAGTIFIYVHNGDSVEGEINVGEFSSSECSLEGINLNIDVGCASGSSIVCGNYFVDVEVGEIDVNGLKSDVIDLSVDCGSVNLSVVGNKSDYSVNTDVSVGSSNVSDQITASEMVINISVDAGDIKLLFE